jgi:galactokinase
LKAFADLRNLIKNTNTDAVFQMVYSTDLMEIHRQRARYDRLLQLFASEYPHQKTASFFCAPGRTEWGGNHTDHQNGHVLCAAINKDIIAAVSANAERVIRLRSEGFAEVSCISIDDLDFRMHERNTSAALIRGIAAAFTLRGARLMGLDIMTASEIPMGSGLSSSAAFEMLITTIINSFCFGNTLSFIERAKIGQWSENNYFGKPSGLMDQCICCIGGLQAIDFRDPEQPQLLSIPFDLDAAGYDLVIVNTGGSHADLTPDYAAIHAEMKSIATCFGQKVLREVNPAVFFESWPSLRNQISDRALLRATHFFAEEQRVSAETAALTNHDLATFFKMVRSSGLSSWTLLQNMYSASRPTEQPLTLGLAVAEQVLGDRGAFRVHGGGFAGTIQAFVPKDLTACFISRQESLFGPETAFILRIRPVGAINVDFGSPA